MDVRRLALLASVVCAAALGGCGDGGEDGRPDGSAGASVNPPDGTAGGAGADGDTARAGTAGSEGGRGGEAGHDGDDGEAPQPDDAGEPFVPVPLSELPSAFAGAICGALLDCLGESALRQLIDREDCEQRITAELRATEFHHMDDAIATGRVLYDPRELPGCLDGVRALGCGVLSESYPQPCVDVLAGNVALQGECMISAECEGPAFCAGAASGTCPSTCTELLGQGADCSADNECGDGLRCAGGRCDAPATAGESCGGDSGRTCALGFNCMGSTDVVVGECVDNASVQIGAEGDACEPGGTLCREGLSCVFKGGDAFHCKPQVGAGEPCHLGLPGQCPIDQYCDAASVTEAGTCRALPGDGERCVLGDACAPGLACVPEGEQPTCRPIRDNGGECSADQACRSGRCVAGTCAPPPACPS